MAAEDSILPLVVRSLHFAAGGKTLLRDVGFTLPTGGVTVLLGPNGAGKSLLLRLCHGLLPPSAGEVVWQGAEAHAKVRRHAMVFQRPVMLRRSVVANVMHALVAMGHPEPARGAREALQRFGLEGLASQPARLLSGGEQQRVAIARAWALRPEVMFLDEPTSQLDPGAVRQIEAMITDLAREGMTILLTTHDLGQAKRLGQRVLFLNNGRLVEDSGAEEFFSTPATTEARAFLSGDLLWGEGAAAG
jgi:tungstate transport system ATP-binding protein